MGNLVGSGSDIFMVVVVVLGVILLYFLYMYYKRRDDESFLEHSLDGAGLLKEKERDNDGESDKKYNLSAKQESNVKTVEDNEISDDD